MGRIPDDEVSGQTNLKLLGRCDMPTLPLNSQRELEHTCGNLWNISEHRVWKWDSAQDSWISQDLWNMFCNQVMCFLSATVSNPRSKINRSCALQALRLSAGKLSSSAWIPTLGLWLIWDFLFMALKKNGRSPKPSGFKALKRSDLD